jgi:4-amino-4-deoxy-L-arabinose transferase-like glycosyltransferase
MPESKPAPKWTFLFCLWFFQVAVAFWQFANLPSDRGNAVIPGLSATRLAGIIIFLLFIAGFGLLAYLTLRKHDRLLTWLNDLLTSPSGDLVIVLSLVVAFATPVVLLILTGLSRVGEVQQYKAYTARLAPFLVPAFFSAIELIAWIAYHRRETLTTITSRPIDLYRRLGIVWAALGVLAVFTAVTGLGLIPDNAGDWGYPGVPLLEWQVILASLVAVLIMILETRKLIPNHRHTDFWISVFVWLLAVSLWLGQPIIPGFSATAPRAPNHEIYPFIDAQVYDEFAQSILIGNGMKGTELPPKPLYVVILALFHLIVGQEYERVIALQTAVLAFFPVVLYLLGKDFFGRPLGLAVALLAVLRDMTSNVAAPFTHALSYSKLYLSELPVALCMALFIFLSYRWAKNNFPGHTAFLAGGVLGIGIMIRSQAGIALPLVLILAWLGNRKSLYPILRGGLLMAVAILLVISPWIWRNWKNTGEFIFVDPQTQTANLALRYNNLNGVEVALFIAPGETQADYNRRLFALFTEAVRADPGGALHAFTNRFFNNSIDNLLVLPLRNDLLDVRELWQPNRPFWEQWDGSPTLLQSIVLVFYILLFGLGLAAAWQRLGVWAFAPLGVNFLYNLWTSVALLSGQRFLLSMDWSVYLYYMIGLFVLIQGVLSLLRSARPYVHHWAELNSAPVENSTSAARPLSIFLITGAFLFMVGASLPLSETIFPKHYPDLSQSEIFTRLNSSQAFLRSGVDSACLQKLIADESLTGHTIRALSPRYYESGDGESTAKQGYAPSEVARLVFQGVGSRDSVVIVPMAQAPVFFPDAADVIFYTGPDHPYNAWFVWVSKADRQEFYLSEESISTGACAKSK